MKPNPLARALLAFRCATCRLSLTTFAVFVSTTLFCGCCLADPLDSWNQVYASPATITSMAYGNGTFIGVGNGLQFISHDGSNWTTYATPPTINNGGIAYGNGTFLMFGTNNQDNANSVLQSTNGAAWTTIYTSSNTLFTAAFGNNIWVFIGTNDIVTATLTSSNWNWSEFQPSFSPCCITYASGNFVIGAFANNGNSEWIFSSSDGVTWQYVSSLPYSEQIWTGGIVGIAYGNGVYATTAEYRFGSTFYSYVFVSSNLVQWTPAITISNGYYPLPVIYGGNQFIACSVNGTYPASNAAYTSSNGYAWTPRSIGGIGFDALTYGQGAFVAACGTEDNYGIGNIYQSGVFATQSNPPATTLGISTYPGVTINGTAGAVYQIQYSTDLNNWQTLTNFMLPYSPFLWIDTSSPVVGQRFYRSIQLQ